MSEQFDRKLALKAAIAAADAAAESLMRDFQREDALEAWMKSPDALVTEADLRSDRAIATALKSAGAAGAVLSEESVSGDTSGELTWLVDPLCGTVPYRLGAVHWGTNIALRRGGRLEVAALSLTALGERLVASAGHGVTFNGEPLTARDPGLPLNESTVGLEVDGAAEWTRLLTPDARGKTRVAWLGSVSRNNTFSSAAYPIGLVCLGRMSGVVFYEIDTVHLAAGALVAAELGAVVSDERGEPLDWAGDRTYPVAVVAWPSVHAALIAAMRGG
jgi:myo-inositol-1(or 4)-monophosphatase